MFAANTIITITFKISMIYSFNLSIVFANWSQNESSSFANFEINSSSHSTLIINGLTPG